jgi:hypothetical protein
MMGERAVKRMESRDGRQYLEIMARDDGFFRFVEHTETTDSGYTFWTPTHWSGIFESADHAESEARATIGWMRNQLSDAFGLLKSDNGPVLSIDEMNGIIADGWAGKR